MYSEGKLDIRGLRRMHSGGLYSLHYTIHITTAQVYRESGHLVKHEEMRGKDGQRVEWGSGRILRGFRGRGFRRVREEQEGEGKG